LGTIIFNKTTFYTLIFVAMNFLKLCPNFVGSFDWKIFIYQKLSKFCFHLSTHSVNFDLKMVCVIREYDQIFPCICEKDPILLSWDYGVEKIIKTEKTYII